MHQQGTLGDFIDAILSAAGMNFRKRLRMAADFFRQFYFWVFFCQRSALRIGFVA
jgi:hypothetical protein